jgi:hypothetical protein
MSLGIIYWILIIIWLVFGLVVGSGYVAISPVGGTLLLFILFVLIGWQVFGPPVHR